MSNLFFQSILERVVLELYRGVECKAVRIFITPAVFDKLDKFIERQPVIFHPRDGEVIEVQVLPSNTINDGEYSIHYGGEDIHVADSQIENTKN